ncbi:MAG: carbohydrate porin [Gemmatimonadota bacterium]|nr:carbohydrate porin [Gemmatimonadota bacterium]
MAVSCRRRLLAVAITVPVALGAQRSSPSSSGCARVRARLLGAQATLIAQDLRPFHAAYSGPMSLVSGGDRQMSQSYGLYAGACVLPGLAAYVDGEMIRGSGISHASGLGGVTNGDVLRQGSVDLGDGPYVARAFVRYTIGLPSTTADSEPAAMDVMDGVLSARRIEITAGKFAATDVFDVNRYANSSRTQFLDWVLFNDGAWDYPADTRGYSNGVAIAWITPRWSMRIGSFQMPRFANGNKFDAAIANARGDVAELSLGASGGPIVRVLAYENHARMGRYAVAIATAAGSANPPDIVADDQPGRIKYGVGFNAELPLADDGNTGAFVRWGWNDGRTESFAFTEVDSHLSAGAVYPNSGDTLVSH